MKKAGFLLPLVAPLALFCACTGVVDGQDSKPADAPAGSAGTTGSGGTTATVDDALPAPAPIRRLTHVEYDNTVADLLGDTSAPATNFAADVAQAGFTNNA